MQKKILTLIPLILIIGCGTNQDSQNQTETIIFSSPTKQIPIGQESTFIPDNNQNLKKSRAFSGIEQDQIRANGLFYLNFLRQKTGMITYDSQNNLDSSAYNHAHYLMLNNSSQHEESSFGIGYTGTHPADRAVYAGYLHNGVGENLSTGNSSVYDSIDAFFSAIYHRFGFLSFTYDEVGIGADSSIYHPHGNAYVFNMGLSEINTLCAGNSFTGYGSYYYNVCTDSNFKIEISAYEDTLSKNKNLNPDYVVWPYANQADSNPVFFEEFPDPLPDCGISGYPVSIQFNPLKSGKIDVQDIKLYYAKNNYEIINTRLINDENDPNSRFSSKEAALFPLDRLLWNTQYKAKVIYTEDGILKNITWNFKTKSLPYPYYTINSTNSSLKIKSGQTYLLYIPPSNCNSNGAGYRMSYRGDINIDSSFYDYNTIQLTVTGNYGSVYISPNSGGDITLTISNSDTASY